jgi:membrane fusion protein (multidrug efflux system)
METDIDPTAETADATNESRPRAIDMKTDFDISPIQADTATATPVVGRAGNGVTTNGAAANGTAANGAIHGGKVTGPHRIDPPISAVEPASTSQPETSPGQRPSRRRIVLIALTLAVLGAAVHYGIPAIYRYFRYESTDDAFVNGHVTYISPRIAGRITEVLVENNQYVEAGQVLAKIDREPFQITADQKWAALAQARQMVDQQVAALDVATAQAQQAHDQARGQLAAVYADWYLLQSVQTLIGYEVASLKSSVANWKLQKANLELAQANLKRGKELVPQGAMSKEEYDQREAAAKVAQQQVDSAVQAVEQARALLDLPASTGPSGTPDATVPSDINETFPGVKYVVASAQQSLAQLGLPIDPSAAKTDKVVEKLGALVASSFLDHVPAVEVAEAQLRQAQAALGGASFDRGHLYNQPSVVQAQKDLEQAELNLSYTELRAPIAGFVNGRSVNPGNQVQVAQALMSVFPMNDVWIDANFKEGQLDALRIGQSVDVYVDAYPGRVFPGRVAGFSAGTGAALSLLPPENATGNFVKVVQRLPVRIELTGPAPQDTPLFIGLSVDPEVDLKTEPRGADAGSRLRGPLPH